MLTRPEKYLYSLYNQAIATVSAAQDGANEEKFCTGIWADPPNNCAAKKLCQTLTPTVHGGFSLDKKRPPSEAFPDSWYSGL
jgi:hypothetical protein